LDKSDHRIQVRGGGIGRKEWVLTKLARRPVKHHPFEGSVKVEKLCLEKGENDRSPGPDITTELRAQKLAGSEGGGRKDGETRAKPYGGKKCKVHSVSRKSPGGGVRIKRKWSVLWRQRKKNGHQMGQRDRRPERQKTIKKQNHKSDKGFVTIGNDGQRRKSGKLRGYKQTESGEEGGDSGKRIREVKIRGDTKTYSVAYLRKKS